MAKKKEKKKNCSPPLKLLLLHSSSSVVEVVRQDQDEPGDVNLLLSPLTLAFAGGNTLPCRYIKRCYLQTLRRARRGAHTTSVWRVKTTETLNVDVCTHVLMSASDTSGGRQLQLTAKPYFIQSQGSHEKKHTSNFIHRWASLRNGTCYFSSERCHKTVCIRLMKTPMMKMQLWWWFGRQTELYLIRAGCCHIAKKPTKNN